MSIKKNLVGEEGKRGSLIQTIVGIVVLIFAITLFFVEPIREVSDLVLAGIAVIGLLLILAPNVLVNIINKKANGE